VKEPFCAAPLRASRGRPETRPRRAGFKPAQTCAKRGGAIRSRVSHFMNKFKKPGFVDYDGQRRVDGP